MTGPLVASIIRGAAMTLLLIPTITHRAATTRTTVAAPIKDALR